MCGNDKIRRLGPVRCRNPIREEKPSRASCKCCRMWLLRSRCNTVPHEKGTETQLVALVIIGTLIRCNTVPHEKGSDTEADFVESHAADMMQHCPPREGD